MNAKHSSSFNNVTSVVSVKLCESVASCQSVCKVDAIHFDVALVTTDSVTKHYSAISLFPRQLRTLQMSVHMSERCVIDVSMSFDVSVIADPDAIETLKIYDEIERATLFLFQV